MFFRVCSIAPMPTRYTAGPDARVAPDAESSGRRRYPSDLTDRQWALVRDLLPYSVPPNLMQPKYGPRDMLDAILYVANTGCTWRSLPHDYPPWESVYGRFRRWEKSGLLQRVLQQLHVLERQRLRRADQPTLGIVDSQSVKTTEEAAPDTVGYDAAKKVKGRKRHVLVDVTGTILALFISVGSVQDRDGIGVLLEAASAEYPMMQKALVDGAYNGEAVASASRASGIAVEMVKRSDDVKGFVPVHKRWIVERTFGWLNRFRRLSKDYEGTLECSSGMVRVAMIAILVRRLSRVA